MRNAGRDHPVGVGVCPSWPRGRPASANRGTTNRIFVSACDGSGPKRFDREQPEYNFHDRTRRTVSINAMNPTARQKGLFFSRPGWLLLAPLLVLASGCATKGPGPVTPFPVQIELDPGLKDKSVLVDVVGVNPANEGRWKSYSMSKYWRDGDPMRADAPKWTCNFISEPTLTKTLKLSDPIWKQWQGATDLFVLADLPGAHTDQPGTQDPRRQILPLFKSAWENGTKELKVRIKESGIEVVTPPHTP
jgi:hypothetical protein